MDALERADATNGDFYRHLQNFVISRDSKAYLIDWETQAVSAGGAADIRRGRGILIPRISQSMQGRDMEPLTPQELRASPP